ERFNDETISKNLSVFMGEKAGEYLPHHVTENEYLERLDPMELEEIKQDLVYHLIRKRCFEDARYKKKWLVIVDGTQLYCGRRKLNEHCLERCSKIGRASCRERVEVKRVEGGDKEKSASREHKEW